MGNKDDDLVMDGFKKLDPHLTSTKAPRIKWGDKYKSWSPERRLKYVEDLAASMNNAAAIIQEERNELGRLCEMKEKQLIKISAELTRNNEMILAEVTKMNEYKQSTNLEIARLNGIIREFTAKAS